MPRGATVLIQGMISRAARSAGLPVRGPGKYATWLHVEARGHALVGADRRRILIEENTAVFCRR